VESHATVRKKRATTPAPPAAAAHVTGPAVPAKQGGPSAARAWLGSGSPFGFGVVQCSLTIGPADDKFEHEADRVARAVGGGQSIPAATISRVPEAGGSSIPRTTDHDATPDNAPLQRTPQGEVEQLRTPVFGPEPGEVRDAKPLVQKMCAECDATAGHAPDAKVQRAPQGAAPEQDPSLARHPATRGSAAQLPVQRASQGEVEELDFSIRDLSRTQRMTEKLEVQRACAGCDLATPSTKKEATAQRKDEAADREPSVQKTAGAGRGPQGVQAAAHAISARSVGAPLPTPIRSTMESRTGADFSGVRVHSDAKANSAASALHAKAFTHRSDIWLARGQSATDLPLMAHELTHVVQQGAAPRRSGSAVRRTVEKPVDTPVQRAMAPEKEPTVQRSSTGVVQRESWLKKAWQATGGKIVDEAGNVLEMGESLAMQVFDEFAPDFAATVRDVKSKGGVFEYMKDKVFGVARDIFKGAREDKGTLGQIFSVVEKLQESGKKIVAGLKSNDCKPLFDAMSLLGDMAMELAGEAWDAIKDFFRPIGDFFTSIWDNYLSKAMDKVSDLAGKAWQGLKDFGKKIWDSTEPVRNKLSAAWDWVKKKLGVGDGPDNQDGLLQWASRKIGEAWQWVLKELDPVIQPMKKLWDKVKAIIPLDKILHLRDTVHAWLSKMKKMLSSVQKKEDVVENQDSLRKEILPAVKMRIFQLKDSVIEAGAWVASEIGGAAASVKSFVGSLQTSSILSPVASLFNWLQQKTDDLADWATAKVQGVFAFFGQGLDRLAVFVEPLYDTLEKMISVVGNVLKKLPDLVMGPFWKAIPKCITDPIRDWIIENVLSQLPVIGTLLTDKTIWPKIQSFAIDLLKTLFVKGDLAGAAGKVFRFFLEVIGVDVELMLRVFAKTIDRLDEVLMDPFTFLKNLGAAVWMGLQKFLDNIAKHLLNGLLGWLLGPLDKLGITGIKDLSLGSVLDLVLQVLGISEGKIKTKLEKAVGPTAVQIMERAWKLLKALWDGGPAALWEEIKSQLSDLKNLIVGGITKWITKEVIEAGIAYLVKLSNPVGAVIQAIQSIYEVVKTVVQKANQILQVVDAVLDGIGDIMNGVIEGAAGMVEGALGKAVPVAISFIANLVGIDDPSPAMQKIVKDIQGDVDKALDWLVDKFKTLAKKLGGAIKSAAGAVAGLLFPSETFDAEGETHTIEAVESGQDYPIVVHSSGIDMETILREAKGVEGAAALEEAYREYKKINIKEVFLKDKKERDARQDEIEAEGQKKIKAFEKVAKLIKQVFPKIPSLSKRKSKTLITYGPPKTIDVGTAAKKKEVVVGGTMMVADPLAKDSLNTGTDTKSDVPPIMVDSSWRAGRQGLYKRGHMLNRLLGGPGEEARNITPLTGSANGLHNTRVESHIKKLMNENAGAILHYEVHVNYPSAPRKPDGSADDVESMMAISLSTKWWELEPAGTGYATKRDGKSGGETIPNIPPYP
jgi:hypothetical protein